MADIFQLLEDGKVSRYFRSRKKLLQGGLISHVTQRAAGKDVLFLDKHDYLAMLAFMKELAQKHETSIYAFCLMPNHLHLLLRPAQDNLHLFFRDLCGRYARRFNVRYERKGHLFGGRFRQSVISDEKYLLAASLYIHLNPVRGGLVSDPAEYRYSSCRLYTMKEPPESFVDPKLVLSLISEKGGEQAVGYKGLLERGTSLDIGNVLEDEGAIERFKTLLKDVFSSLRGIEKSPEQSSTFPSFDSLDEKISDFDDLKGSRRLESVHAKKYLIEQLLARGYTRTQIADKLGISRKTVYNLSKR